MSLHAGQFKARYDAQKPPVIVEDSNGEALLPTSSEEAFLIWASLPTTDVGWLTLLGGPLHR
jgi:hypothetical protein